MATGTREQVTETTGLGAGGMALPGQLSTILTVIASKLQHGALLLLVGFYFRGVRFPPSRPRSMSSPTLCVLVPSCWFRSGCLFAIVGQLQSDPPQKGCFCFMPEQPPAGITFLMQDPGRWGHVTYPGHMAPGGPTRGTGGLVSCG